MGRFKAFNFSIYLNSTLISEIFSFFSKSICISLGVAHNSILCDEQIIYFELDNSQSVRISSGLLISLDLLWFDLIKKLILSVYHNFIWHFPISFFKETQFLCQCKIFCCCCCLTLTRSRLQLRISNEKFLFFICVCLFSLNIYFEYNQYLFVKKLTHKAFPEDFKLSCFCCFKSSKWNSNLIKTKK